MLHARLLGTYDLRLDNRSIDLSSRPAQSLLAYLLLNPNQPIRREKLAGLIWPDSTESNARSNLRHALWRVRKSLDSDEDAYLHADDLTVSFQLQKDDWVDVNVLDAHLQDGISTDALIEILSVYEGELLPGFYEDWVGAERERLKTLFEQKMDVLLDRLVAESRWEEAVKWGERWISLGFTPEHAFRAMMIAHGGLGDLGKAAAVYQRCVLALERDLGVKPSRQTREIYQRLMAGTLKDVLPQTKNKLAPRGYKLLDQIGEGSFGAVYRAFQPEVNREVAVKVILPQYANDPDFIRRFEAEAQVVARLEHPHIVPLYDYWREPDNAYLVMRYLRVGSLADLLECGPLDLERASALVEQIGAALAAAHRQGIAHRDLKPANILLDESGNFYLSDFGIAKDIASQIQATLTGQSLGTPLYMSPEQLLGEQVTPRSDIYSFGLVLYQALSGELPYPDDSLAALIEKQLDEPLPLVTAVQPEIPEEIDQVLQLATAKQPEGRFQDVVEVIKAFQAALSGKSLAFQPTSPEVVIENPYKGLRPFREADAEDFFGRDAMVQRLLARLDSMESFGSGNGHAPGEGRFLAVVGPSGSGKSSLVKAGLIPALRQGGFPGSENWFVVDFIPGTHPMEELEAALLRVAVNPPESLLGQLNEGERGLLRAVRRILPSDETVELVLVIDQFEELFTLVAEEERRARFLDSLVAAVLDPRTRLRVVITLRADFTGWPLQYLGFGELFRQGTEFVLPMTSDELEQAIAGPAKRAGLILEPGLATRIIWEVSDQPGTLPLLQHALTELFERREGRRLTLAAYLASGGVSGALGQRAEELYSSLDKRGQELTRQMFLRLITLGEGVYDGSKAPDTRRRVLRAELEDLAIPTSDQKSILTSILDFFGRYRLLTFDRDPITHGPTVEVAHEALLREWGRLREWIDESRADVRLQRLLTNAASEWENANRDESFLLTGAHLAQYEGWSQTTSLALTQLERDYLTSSLDLRVKEEAVELERQAREARLSQRIQRMLQVLVGVFLVAAIISGGLAIYSSRQRQAALRQVSIGLATQAQAELDGSYPERSVLLALEALEKYPYTWQAERALGQIVREFRLRHILTGHRDTVTDAAWSPDGTRLATTGMDGTLRIWDARTLEELLNISAHLAFEEGFKLGVRELAWSPDGRRIATAASDRTSKVWDATSGREILTYYGHSDEVWGVTWSPDGAWIASASKDGSIKVWEATSGTEKLTLSGNSAWVRKVAWSPDGTHIASAGEDGTARIWEAETGDELAVLSGHTSGVWSVSWSPDGKQVATAGDDGTVRIWNALNGQELSDIRLVSPVWQAAWSPDGSQLATTNAAGLAQVWDVSSGNEVFALQGRTREPFDIAWSPDGKSLATTGGPEFSARLWDASPATLTLSGAQEGIIWAAWSPDGKRIATSALDKTAVIWDSQTGKALHTLLGHTKDVQDVFWSPDGTRIVTTGWDNLAKVWDANTGEEILTFSGHVGEPISKFINIDALFGGGWSPDGSRIMTIGGSGWLRIWDARTGEEYLAIKITNDTAPPVRWSPDGTRVASCQIPQVLQIWDAATGHAILGGFIDNTADLSFGDAIDMCMASLWSPEGDRILTTSWGGNGATIWDAKTGEKILAFTENSGGLSWPAWSPNGKRVATGETSGVVKIWDAETGAVLLNFSVPISDVLYQLDWSPDGKHLTSTGTLPYVEIYWVWQSTQDLLDYTRECCVVRQLSSEERQQFGLP